MPERIQRIINRIIEWWNKFTAKQKTLIIIVVAAIVMGITIIITVLSQTKYELLLQCVDTKEASEVTALLDAQGIQYRTSSDSLRIEVDKKMQAEANMLLGANDIQSAAYSIDNVFSGGLSTTEADKQRKFEVYLEKRLENEIIVTMDAIKTAKVELYLPENDGTLLAKEEEASAFIMLGLEGEFTEDQAGALAKGIAVALGKKTQQGIEIIDNRGNSLFSADAAYNMAGSTSNQLSVKNKFQAAVQNDVKKLLQGTNDFNKIEVSSNLVLDFSSLQTVSQDYSVANGRSEGYLSHEELYNAESSSGLTGVPGTDSNDEDTSYQFQDNSNNSSTETEEVRDYLPNKKETVQDIPPGAIKYEESSISITGTTYNILNEEDVRARGELDGVKWEEYKAANSEKTRLTVDEELYDVVANATGIAKERITIFAYRENVFMDAEGFQFDGTNAIQLGLIVVILGLLAFVVIRSMRTGKETEQEEELSVESLLQSQPDLELENISMDEGSEAKRLIDKFVEDNPEAAAALLRNWLNEDWA